MRVCVFNAIDNKSGIVLVDKHDMTILVLSNST